jgi:hypothetical protein
MQECRPARSKLGCQICGYNKCATALEWHHRNLDEKESDPSVLLNSSLDSYYKEIEKCILVCSNCHREIHEGLIVIME